MKQWFTTGNTDFIDASSVKARQICSEPSRFKT